MMSLSSQKRARAIRDLSFCYLCGLEFVEQDKTNHDHVPPEKLFIVDDRNFPIKLKTHTDCHDKLNLDDEVLTQLIGLLHNKSPSYRNDKLKIEFFKKVDSDEKVALFKQRNLEYLIRRFLKGFHAALYKEPLMDGADFAIQSPFPSAKITDNGYILEPIKEQHYKFVECIKKNRIAKSLDFIKCNNDKLKYDCVWVELSDKSWGCIFAIDLYNWKELADSRNFQSRGCVGLYRQPDGNKPSEASVSTNLEFQLEDKVLTDPF